MVYVILKSCYVLEFFGKKIISKKCFLLITPKQQKGQKIFLVSKNSPDISLSKACRMFPVRAFFNWQFWNKKMVIFKILRYFENEALFQKMLHHNVSLICNFKGSRLNKYF